MSGALSIPELPVAAVKTARLPEIYERSKITLAECERVDQCQEWANKFEALASYARQAGDEELRQMADRIQARAIRRCGELLREIESQRGGDRRSMGACPPIGRVRAADEAGLSEHQRKTALRVANVSSDEFEGAVESANPPTVTKLAERGKKKVWDRAPGNRAKRSAQVRELAERGFNRAQIASELGISEHYVSDLSSTEKIALPSATLGKARRLEVNRIIGETVIAAQSITAGLELVESRLESVDRSRIDEWIGSLEASIGSLRRLIAQLRRHAHVNGKDR